MGCPYCEVIILSILEYQWFPPQSKGLKGDILVAVIATIPAYIATISQIEGHLCLVNLGWFAESVWLALVFAGGAAIVLTHIN